MPKHMNRRRSDLRVRQAIEAIPRPGVPPYVPLSTVETASIRLSTELDKAAIDIASAIVEMRDIRRSRLHLLRASGTVTPRPIALEGVDDMCASNAVDTLAKSTRIVDILLEMLYASSDYVDATGSANERRLDRQIRRYTAATRKINTQGKRMAEDWRRWIAERRIEREAMALVTANHVSDLYTRSGVRSSPSKHLIQDPLGCVTSRPTAHRLSISSPIPDGAVDVDYVGPLRAANGVSTGM